MSAKLSRTPLGITIFQPLLLVLLFGPFLGERPRGFGTLQNSAAMPYRCGGHWLEENSLGRGYHCSTRALLDIELSPQAGRNDDLSLGCESGVVGL